MATERGISITMMDEALREVRRKLGDMERKAPSVMANALNQTLTELKKYISKQVVKRYTYKRKLQKPRAQRASRKNLKATLFFDRKDASIPSYDFSRGTYGSPRDTPGQKLAAKILKDGSLKEVGRAFVMGEQVVRRLGAARLPIKIVRGPSEHSMVKRVWCEEDAKAFTGRTLGKKLDEQIDKQFLRKWGSR